MYQGVLVRQRHAEIVFSRPGPVQLISGLVQLTGQSWHIGWLLVAAVVAAVATGVGAASAVVAFAAALVVAALVAERHLTGAHTRAAGPVARGGLVHGPRRLP